MHGITNEHINLLETLVCISEKNGKTAYVGIASKWCQFLDCFSEDQDKGGANCEIRPNICSQSAQIAVLTEKPADCACSRGIQLYSVPIWANSQIVGALSIGYGDPPLEPEVLDQLACKFAVDSELLC